MSNDSKSTTTEQSQVTPTYPSWVTDASLSQQGRIDALAASDPQSHVAPASALQNQAFGLAGGLANRMGGGALTYNTPTQSPPPSSNQAMLSAPFSYNSQPSGTPDYAAYVRENPDLMAEYNRIQGDGFGPNLPKSFDTDGDGRLGVGEYGLFQDTRFNQPNNEGRVVPMVGGSTMTASPVYAQSDPITGAALGQVDATQLTSPDPNAMFAGAGLLAGSVGQSGANEASRNVLGDAQGYNSALANLDDLRSRDVATMTPETLLSNLDSYMNPYIDDVVNTTLAQYDREAGKSEAALAARAAGSGAFGGSRYGISEAELIALNALNRAGTEAGLRSDAFDTGAQLSNLDADRRQQAGAFNADARNQAYGQEYDLYSRGLLANMDYANQANMFNADAANNFALSQFDADNTLGMFNAGQRDTALARQLEAAGLLGDLGATIGAEDRANIGLLADLGEQQRAIESDYRNADATMAQLLASLQAQQNYPMYQGQTSSGTSTTTSSQSGPAVWNQAAGAAGNAAAAGAILFSDERLKTNIETAGFDAQGRRWVDYNYTSGGPRMRGVIAQEIQNTDPHAVIVDESGFLKVDYSKLGGA